MQYFKTEDNQVHAFEDDHDFVAYPLSSGLTPISEAAKIELLLPDPETVRLNSLNTGASTRIQALYPGSNSGDVLQKEVNDIRRFSQLTSIAKASRTLEQKTELAKHQGTLDKIDAILDTCRTAKTAGTLVGDVTWPS